jgi:hypothetical protein
MVVTGLLIAPAKVVGAGDGVEFCISDRKNFEFRLKSIEVLIVPRFSLKHNRKFF